MTTSYTELKAQSNVNLKILLVPSKVAVKALPDEAGADKITRVVRTRDYF